MLHHIQGVSINCHKLISLWEENINLILSFLAILSINAYLDRHKLEDLRDIAEEKGLSESQEEEAKHLVESNPDLIRNSEEEEAARALFQGKGKGNDYCGKWGCPKEGCFGYESLVTTGSGEQKLMRDLKIGDEVVSDQTGALTEFVGWIQLERNGRVKFLEIKTDDGEELTLTGTHIVFYYEDGKPTPTFARNLSPGNVLVGGTGEVFYEYDNAYFWFRSYICRKKLSQA